MILPPISIVNGASHVHEMLYHYGRACAEAALEAAAKLLDGMEEEDGDCGICALDAAEAIRNIKIED